MIYLELFLGFLKVGCFSFGGAYAAIPLIRDVVLSYGWIDDEMLACMIAVSESTPGSIMVNLATYVGASLAGVPGAVIATATVVLPAFLIILLVTAVLSKVIKNKYVQAILQGVRPCMVGMILATGGRMIFRNLQEVSFDIRAIVITLILAGIYFGSERKCRRGISPIQLILLSAVMGVAVYGL